MNMKRFGALPHVSQHHPLYFIMALIIALLAWLYLNQHKLNIQLFQQKHFLNTFLIVNN